MPVGPGAVSVEAAYNKLDLDDATQMGVPSGTQNALQTQGDGWYAQAGYYFENLKLQPWVGYEKWESDAADGAGGWDGWRAGLTYFFHGHNDNIKAGYESVKTEQPIAGSTEDTINTFIIGFYITY